MATLYDERPEDDEAVDNINEVAEHQEPVAQETPEEEIPEKYQGKSVTDIVRMHQEAEKLLGRQSSEVGELRSVVDSYIQTQLDTKQAAPVEPEEEVDFFSDPDKAVERAIKNHPSIKAAEAQTQQYQKSNAMAALQQRHPDMQAILEDAKFGEWIKGSKIRTQLFAQADRQYDHEAADELFTNWKERQQAVGNAVANDKDNRKTALKAASTGTARGSGEPVSNYLQKLRELMLRRESVKIKS
jgi:hypothetical protein